jgi:two-component system nitrogen regulation sensor histidine kinase NtrY
MSPSPTSTRPAPPTPTRESAAEPGLDATSRASEASARASGGELPLAERRRRRRELVLGVAVAAIILLVVFFERRLAIENFALPFADSVLFLFLNALNVILILLLAFLIARNLVKLVFERRSGILGAHLNAKFVLAFVAIASVPTAMLFGVAAFFLTASIDAWFDLKVDRALDQSRQVADAYYENAARDALFWGRRIADEITGERLLREESREKLSELVHSLQRHYGLGVVEVFSGTGEELVAAVNPEIPAATFSRADSELVRSALSGNATSRVEASGSGDVIRGAVPVFSSFRSVETVGAVVVNYVVTTSLTRKVAEIHAALDEYRRLQPNAAHVRTLYLMELLLAFLVILLLATWWGFRMAKSVTGPIGALAAGTEAVARGDLDVEVETTSDDEIGLLVRSFNAMTRDLREARGNLERSNAELDQRRRSMEVVLRSVSAGVVSIDADGRVGTMNPSAQRLLGIPPGTPVTGRKLEEVLVRPEQLDAVRELAAKLRPGIRDMIRQQVQLPAAPGEEPSTLLVSLNLLRDEDGGNLGMVIVYDDYTQLVKAQRMEAWREVARRIAHEIKNPLTPIQLSAQRIRRRFRERLSREPEDAQVFDECVDAITSQVDSLKLLVNEFSNFARLPEATPRPDDLNRLVAEVVASYQGTEGVTLETELDPTLPSVELDRDQMRRVLTNLLDNAIAAVREARERGYADASRVEVHTVYDEPLGTVRFEVADEGAGIRPEDRRRIFEPYFSTKRGGTGLGLAIVSRIVADHRGYVRVHDRRPRGTSFVVELPVRA